MSIRIISLVLAVFACGASIPAGAQETQAGSNPVVHVEVLGMDGPRLQRFYSAVFGWKVTTNPVGYGYVPVAPSAPVTLTGGVGTSPQKQPLVIFYVKVEDPMATLQRAEANGGRIVVPPTDVPGGVTFARLADPEGNVIGIVRRPN